MKPKQLSFLSKLMPDFRADHGGDIGKGKRKGSRPFSAKNAIHVVFRSTRARGDWSLLTRQNKDLVEKLLQKSAKKNFIRVYRFVNVGNHLHLLIKTRVNQHFPARDHFSRFLKEFGGSVAFTVTGAKKASPKGGFWEKRVYTRIVSWGRDYDRIKEYFIKNIYESKGLCARSIYINFKSIIDSMNEAGVGPPAYI